jgi:PAS domain S-box-containing protein
VGGIVSTAENYQRLREWYLARLRNLAQNAASSAMHTPAQLIALDKETVKLLVQSRSNNIRVEDEKAPPLSSVQFAALVLLVILIAGAVLALMEARYLFVLTQLLGAVGCFFYFKVLGNDAKLKVHCERLISEVDADAAKKANSVEGSIDQLTELIEELVQREHSIADFARSVIVCFDKDLSIDSVSPSCMGLWGYHQFELIGSNLSKFIFHEDADHFKNVLRIDQPIEFVTRLRKQDNSVIDVSWYVEWSTQFCKYFATADDITDRMTLERARQEFIMQLTHDMRSPLNGVAMTLDMVNEGILGRVPFKVADSLERAQKGLSCVVELINDILDVEKIRNRQGRIEASKISMYDLSRSTVNALQVVADERKVKLDLVGEDQSCFADPKLIKRVLNNLVNNAISFSPEAATVTVKIERIDENVKVSVSDRGPGIHPDYHTIIFERFGVVPQVANNNRVSSGLGLWICRDIIRAHSGFIGVDSIPGQGSTFWFLLPGNSLT